MPEVFQSTWVGGWQPSAAQQHAQQGLWLGHIHEVADGVKQVAAAVEK